MRIAVKVPGDKSITQRALILSSLARGASRLSGLLAGGDAESTAGALRALGAAIPPVPSDGSEITLAGVGLAGLRSPAEPLDLGNSGTGARLLTGVLAGSGLRATVTGDASLRARPMRRVTEPLALIGASFASLEEEGRLPLAIEGARPARSVDWTSRVASAQVKSAVLLGGLLGRVPVRLVEPRRSRDHTERMLRSMGADVRSGPARPGWLVELLDSPEQLEPLDLAVPGDPSSAAFLAALAVAGGAGRAEMVLPDIGLNPTRAGFFAVLLRMGARVSVDGRGSPHGRGSLGGGTELPSASETEKREPVGTVRARRSRLRGVEIGPEEVPGLIDELPLVAVLGAVAEGETVIRGARELRVKESDRIGALVHNLRALGAEVEEREDGLSVLGSDRVLRGRVRSFGDHRIAMAFAVLGMAPGNEVDIDDPRVASVSYPGFWRTLGRVATETRRR